MWIIDIELGNVCLYSENQELTYLDAARTWINERPATIKIAKIAGLVLGVGIGLIALHFIYPYPLSIGTAAAFQGAGCGIIAGLISGLVTCIVAVTFNGLTSPKALSNTHGSCLKG